MTHVNDSKAGGSAQAMKESKIRRLHNYKIAANIGSHFSTSQQVDYQFLPIISVSLQPLSFSFFLI
jgi:hypothetical protein